MVRRANAGYTTHELMADSGHKSMSMVQHYTRDFDKKKLAASGAAKMRAAQNENADYTNKASPLPQTSKEILEKCGDNMSWRSRQDSNCDLRFRKPNPAQF